jgi:hypothetical protein
MVHPTFDQVKEIKCNCALVKVLMSGGLENENISYTISSLKQILL